jgi:hypothetical protein
MRALLVLLAGLMGPGVARATPEISGYLNVFDYLDHSGLLGEAGIVDATEKPLVRQARSGFRTQLQLDGRPSDAVSYLIRLNFEYDSRAATRDPTATAEDGFRVFPREAYVDLNSLGPLDLRLGRQYLFWGRFEWGGLLDLLAPWDFSAIAAEKENFRLAVDAVDARLYLGNFVLEAAVLTNFQPNRVSLAIPEQVGPFRAELRPANLPGHRISELETAVRARYEGPSFFAALDYYRGHNRLLSMHTEAVGEGIAIEAVGEGIAIEALHFTPEYHPLQVVGVELEWLLASLAIKLEAGYSHTDDPQGTDIEVGNRNLAAMIGASWAAAAGLTLDVQYGQTHLLDYDRQAEYLARKLAGEPDPYVSRTVKHRIVSRVRYEFTDTLRWQAMAMTNAPDTNLLGLTFIAWDLRPETRLYCGSILFTGPEGTPFGRLEGESRFFMELKVAL